MTAVLSRMFSPTPLLYSFILITQTIFGLFFGRETEPPPAFTLIYALSLFWIVGWWLRTDSRKRQIPWVYDMGFFLYLVWPVVIPYYLVKSRGAKGLLVILGFAGAYVGALIVGMAVSVMTSSSL